jgi:hypothetical protein
MYRHSESKGHYLRSFSIYKDKYYIKMADDIKKSLGSMDSKEIMKRLEAVSENPEVMGQITNAVTNNPDIQRMAPSLAADPQFAKLAEDAKQKVSRKEALKMKKQINHASHQSRISKGFVTGTTIIPSRKLKAIEVPKVNKDTMEPDTKELSRHLGVGPKDKLESLEIDDYMVFYNANNRGVNKRIVKLFPGKSLGNTVIIFNKNYEPLSVESVEKYESKV